MTISDEPIVTQFQYRLNYPAYTRLQSQTFPANTGDIQALFGTELIFTGESNKPLETASLAFEDSDNVTLEITARHLTESQRKQLETKWKADGRSETHIPPTHLTEPQEKIKRPRTMRGSFIAQQSGNYRIQITDAEGFTNRDPINYTLTGFQRCRT